MGSLERRLERLEAHVSGERGESEIPPEVLDLIDELERFEAHVRSMSREEHAAWLASTGVRTSQEALEEELRRRQEEQ